MQIGNEIFAVHLTVLLAHQVAAAPGEDAHDDAADLQSLALKDRVELADAVALMQQVVHEDDRAAEGLKRAHLIGKRTVAGVFHDGEIAPVGGKALVGVQGFGHGAGDDLAGEDLSVGHAEEASLCAARMVVLLHAIHQRLIEKLRVEAQQELAGVQCRQGRPQAGTGLLDRLEHFRRVTVRRLDAEQQILDQHHGHPHIDVIEIRHLLDPHESKLHQHIQKCLLPLRAAAQGIGMVVRQAADQKLVQEHPHMLP